MSGEAGVLAQLNTEPSPAVAGPEIEYSDTRFPG